MKDKLKKRQPVAYRILKNSLLHKNYAHAYLFSGDAGCGKMETAIFFAQSLLCEQEGFACEKCEICQRVKQRNYADLIVVDGKDKSIKKEDILHIQEEFSKTALESSKKIYILNLVENATPEALNSLLKFLEEPVSDVVAILTTQHPDRVLPTILSRCQRIPFRKMNIQEGIEYAKEEGLDELDAYLCANLVSSKEELVALSEDENYQNARIWAMQTIENFSDDAYGTLLEIQRVAFNEKKENDKIQFSYYADILMIFFRSILSDNKQCTHSSWSLCRKKYTKEQGVRLYDVIVKNKNKLTKSVSVKLLADSMLIQMKEAL